MKKLKFITLTLAIIITLPMLQSCLDDNDHQSRSLVISTIYGAQYKMWHE